MPHRTTLTTEKIKQVALLLSRGWTQEEIGEQIGMKQSTVSRAKKTALEKGYLELEQKLECKFGAAEVEALLYQIHGPELLDRLRRMQPANATNLRRLRILEHDTVRPGWSEQQIESYRKAFGERVAEYLLEDVFPHIRSMGVTWGGTLLAVVRGIAKAARSRAGRHAEIEFLPVCGAPPDAIEAALRSSSNLVASLDAAINETARNPNNFTGVAAAISSKFTAAERRAIEKYFRQDKGYGRVFGTGKQVGRVAEMDAVMTGVGTANAAEDPWIVGAAEAAGVDVGALSGCVLGNIGGWFLAREDLVTKEKKLVERVNARWTGIRLEHYLACSTRARRRGHGGTILVTSGERVDIVLECVRRGLIAELLIDAELASGLGRAIGFRPNEG